MPRDRTGASGHGPGPTTVEQLRRVSETIPHGFLLIGRNGRIEAVNAATASWVGCRFEDLLRRPAARVLPAAIAERLDDLTLGDTLRDVETRLLGADGSGVDVLLFASVLPDSADPSTRGAIACNLLDIRERKRLQLELEGARELESLGRIAAGVAHEIETRVQSIGDSVSFLEEAFDDLLRLAETYRVTMEALDPDALEDALVERLRALETEVDLDFLREEAPEAFKRSREEVVRAAEVASAVKAFGRPTRPERAPADLNAAIGSALAIAREEYEHIANVDTDLGKLPAVVCHIGHLNEVFLNLIVNAAHAIRDAGADPAQRGTIRIRTRATGDAVEIRVEDSGRGIPPETLDRIFDPLFTSGEAGYGARRGLARARSCIEDEHGGALLVESEPERGTTFTIRLPRDE